jgi:hypothetical protein
MLGGTCELPMSSSQPRTSTRRKRDFIPECSDCRKDAWAQMMHIMRKAHRQALIALMRNHHRLGHVNEFENCGFYECDCLRLKHRKIGEELR